MAAVDARVVGPLNVCTGVGTSMTEVARLAIEAAGYGPDRGVFVWPYGMPSGVAYRVGDPTRMREVYEPTVSVAEGVTRMVEAARQAKADR